MPAFARYFKNLPIPRKINFAILFTCATALGVTAIAIFSVQLLTFRHAFTHDLEATGHMLAQNACAAITFNDRKGAEEILTAVRVKPFIVRAEIQVPDGSLFASYGRKLSNASHPFHATDGAHFDGPFLLMNQPVILAGERIGTLRFVCDYQTEYQHSLSLYALILAGVLGASVLLAMAISHRLQRLISMPILTLADTAHTVAERKDYGLRAPRLWNDEVGELTTAFNQMLARIQKQDEDLKLSQGKLEALVNSIDGVVWECNPETLHFTFVSQQCARFLGFDEAQWLAPDFWQEHLHPEDLSRAARGFREEVGGQSPCLIEYRMIAADGRNVWVRQSSTSLSDGAGARVIRGILMDITSQKNDAQELEKLHRQLVETSRQAGMSEVATGVLHNVGNVLNSVNVSVNLVNEELVHSQLSHLPKISEMMEAHRQDLGDFLTLDLKGRRVLEFLSHLSTSLTEERSRVVAEMRSLQQNVEHIKEIVSMQQSYARVLGVVEDLPPSVLLEDAIRMNEGAFVRHGVTVHRDFAEVPLVRVDKHKVLQILVNLFRNAKYAMDAANRDDKVIALAVRMNGSGRVKVSVKDNGVGIEKENLTRIFGHGFTTKKEGHGFGLHSGALAAREMGGDLQVFSEGPGKGATFTLELPIVPEVALQTATNQ